MDAELKEYLIGMEERIVSSLKGYVNERSELVKEYVNERSELVETKLLTELPRRESLAEARSRTITAALRAIDLENESMDALTEKREGRRPQ